jgi:cobalt-zinc-cadmium efflux system outer membrane protein
LRKLLPDNPDLARLGDEIQRQQLAVRFERTFRIPDLIVSAGPRHVGELGQTAWAAGIALPLPIFDRNQGNVRAAEYELERTRKAADAIRVNVEAALVETIRRLEASYMEVHALEEEVVPASSDAFAAMEIGYREGKFGFIEVLDAQRVLFDARAELQDSLEAFYIARTVIERLIGRSLEEVSSTEVK